MKRFYLLIGMVIIMGLLPQKNVSADSGPRPIMAFEFVQDIPGPDLTMVSWSLINCQDNECLNPGEVLTSQRGFDCVGNLCDAHLNYGIQYEYFQLEIAFSDGVTRKSNVFTSKFFDAQYRVTISPDALIVGEDMGSDFSVKIFEMAFVGYFLFCPAIVVVILAAIVIVVVAMAKKEKKGKIINRLGKLVLWTLIVALTITGLFLDIYTFLLTLLIETILAFVILRFRKLPVRRVLYGVIAANIFTQPIFVFLMFALSSGMAFSRIPTITIILEVIIWLAEAGIVYFVQQKQISFKYILVLTFILNAVSYGIGLIMPF